MAKLGIDTTGIGIEDLIENIQGLFITKPAIEDQKSSTVTE